MFAGIGLCALALRWYLFPNLSNDLTDFVGIWYDFLRAHGLHSFRYQFADYTPPYLYMLYVLTKLPLAKVTAIKSLSVFFDLILALSVFLVVRQYKRGGWLPYFAAITCLFLPTVFINSSLWGQCDALYTSFLIFSYYALLRKKYKAGWALWGVAFACKLQAVFFLPFLFLLWLRRPRYWYEPLIAVPVIGALILSPAIIGQPIRGLLSVYSNQANEYHFLTLNAPNIYQWIPNQFFGLFHTAGIMLAAGVTLTLILALYLYVKHMPKQMLLSCCLLILTVPFVLPQMHERYFYPAEIFSLLVAFIVPRLFWLPIIIQITSFFAYTPLLLQVPPPISLGLLPFGMLIAIVGLGIALFGARSFSTVLPSESATKTF